MDHLELKNDLKNSPLFSEGFKKTCTVLEFLIYSGMEFHVFTPLRQRHSGHVLCGTYLPNAVEKQRNFVVLDTAQNHGNNLFLDYNVRQCNMLIVSWMCNFVFKSFFNLLLISLLSSRVAAKLYASGWFVRMDK